jgi:hypothetical protein
MKYCLVAALTGVPFLASCAMEVDEPTAEIDQAIENGAAASRFQIDRAVNGPNCTATRIAPHWILSAAHCQYNANDSVAFYGYENAGSHPARFANVVSKHVPPGVFPSNDPLDPADGDYEDSAGNFADIAVVKINFDDTYGTDAAMAWTYPGEDKSGQAVGRGWHDGANNPNRILRQRTDATDDATDDGGDFELDHAYTEAGDSGGPFYYQSRVLGVLFGETGTPGFLGSTYTSVPVQLPWILSTIGYQWSGAPSIQRAYLGSTLQGFTARTERVCQYACEHTAACEAYNYNSNTTACWILDDVTGTTPAVSTRGGLRFGGPRAAVTGDVVGYVRSDGTNAVVHRASNGHVHELYPAAGGWASGDISGAAPLPSSRLTAYRRSDGINTVVYRSGTVLIELALVNGTWGWGQLPTAGITPVGAPAAYVRADGVSAVVYRASTGHIIELQLGGQPGGWVRTNLSTASGTPALAASDPTAYARSDGYSAVVYRTTTNKIHELTKRYGSPWSYGDLTGANTAAGNPRAYLHRDGINAVVYRSPTNRIMELWLDGTWHVGDITGAGDPPQGDPQPFLRTDGLESVIYRSTANQIWELANQSGWNAYNLSAPYGGGTPTTDPSAYVRNDQFNAVIFGTAASHVGELAYVIDAPAWYQGDLGE